MNILFTFFVPSGGVETLNRQRFYALSKYGVHCHFLYTQPGTGLQNKIDATIFVMNDYDEILRIVWQGNYDAVVICSDVQLLQLVKKSGYPGIIIYDNQGLGFNKEYAAYYLKNHVLDIINDNCDGIMYPKTPHLIDAFQTIFPHKKQFYFDNCFHTGEFNYRKMPPSSHPIIGWVGRLEENKNWRDYLSIGAQLVNWNSKIQLWMFEDNQLGDPNERIAFNQMVDELNLRSSLTVYANQPHSKMAEYFSMIGDSGGFLCSTSRVESFGYAVLEALVCRSPVLSTDSDGVRSFIKHNVTGKFFEFGNIDEAVGEAIELMTNLALRENLRNNGARHIETTFSPDLYAANFMTMIRCLQKQI